MGQKCFVGLPTTIEAYADRSPYAAVFEDDGEVAYFYGLDTRRATEPVVDAMHIYNVCTTPDRDIARDVEIVWSRDQQRVALLIDGFPHAAFDFAAHRGYCRTNLPSGSVWSPGGHRWDDHAVDFLTAARESGNDVQSHA